MSYVAAALSWRAGEFWAATPHETWAAIEGYERLHCRKPSDETV